jgi:cytoskeleton protein RodZ
MKLRQKSGSRLTLPDPLPNIRLALMTLSPTVGVGAALRCIRETRGISLKQIAAATKLSPSALEAIERDDLSRLPGGIFTRAFVRAYAKELGADPEHTLEAFLAQFPDQQVEPHVAQPAVPAEPEATRYDVARTIVPVGILIVTVATAVLWLAYGAKRQSPVAHEALVMTPDLVETLTPEATPAAPLGVADSPRFAGGAAGVPSSGDLTIVIDTDRTCWVAAAADGRPVVSRLLAAGERTVLRGTREVTFKVGDAGAVRLQVNGEMGRRLGGPGQVVTARIDQANFRRYLEQQ